MTSSCGVFCCLPEQGVKKVIGMSVIRDPLKLILYGAVITYQDK